MKTNDRFDFISSTGNVWKDCHFAVNSYRNGNKALSIVRNDEEGYEDIVLVCSVNGQRICRKDEIGIKNWSENRGVDDFLIKLGIIEDCYDSMESSGFVNILYYKLTKSGKELFKGM